MDAFRTFAKAVHARYLELATGELFVVDLPDIFERYLAAFPAGSNPMMRERTEHDCNTCKQFIRKLGVVISIGDDGQVRTVWDHWPEAPQFYNLVGKALDAAVRAAPIVSVFRTKEGAYGKEKTADTATDKLWYHFHGAVAAKHHTAKPEEARGERHAIAQVLGRGLSELTPAAFETVLDLIDSNALYRGAEFRKGVAAFRDLQQAYLASEAKPAFVWAHLDHPAARVRNTAIGTLLIDLSAGVELDEAVRKFETMVAPTNYKRPTALITPKMVDAAVATLQELGLEGAVERRMARISDVNVNDILFVDNAVRGQMKGGLTGLLMESTKPAPVDLKHATPITIDEFLAMDKQTIDVLVENKHLGNFVTLTAPVRENTGRLFKWGNDFAWSYDGEVTDSIKQRVKRAGGNVEARLRVSLAWSNYDDLDIHAHCPDGHVYFGNKAGILDVDMNAGGPRSREPVENLAWKSPKDGHYRITVHNFAKRENVDFGFQIELAIGDRVEQYVYAAPVPDRKEVEALQFVIARGALGGLRLGQGLVGGSVATPKWGLTTGQLVRVDTLMRSPNHWGEHGTGNLHWFFLLHGCKNPDPVRGIYNEFLRPSLEPHRKVFEVLGAKTKCPPADEQLSGVGFSSTRGDDVTVVVNGKRAYTIRF